MDAAFRLLFDLAAAADRRLSILMYHRVLPEPDPLRGYEIDQAIFRRQLEWIAGIFRVLPLPDAVAALRAGRLPPRSLCITFDDGYRDNLSVAVPILREFGFHATFFMTTGYAGQRCMWNDMVIEAVRATRDPVLDLSRFGLPTFALDGEGGPGAAVPAIVQAFKYLPAGQREQAAESFYGDAGATSGPLMLDEAGIRGLVDAGMEVGGHTVSHPILTTVEPRVARAEIEDNKRELERICGRRLRLFAYPNGKPGRDYGPEHVEMVRAAGFEGAVASAEGMAGRATDRFQLPRFTPWDRSRPRYLLRLLANARHARQAVPG